MSNERVDLTVLRVVVPTTTYNAVKELSADLGLTMNETTTRVINDGLNSSANVCDKIIKMLENMFDSYHSGFVAGMERHHQLMHEAIEKSTDVSVADDAYYTAESYNEKALVVAEVLCKARQIMEGK